MKPGNQIGAMSDYIATRNAQARASGASTRLFFGTAEEIGAQRAASHAGDKQMAQTAKTALPKGISGGKVTAIVAGVALAGGALYALSRKKEDVPVGPWTARVESERASGEPSLQR
jgi:hypothetical protein